MSKQNIELTRAWRNLFIPFPVNRESVYFHLLLVNVTFAYEFTQNHKTRHDVQILAILSLRDFPVPLIYIFFFTLLTFYSRDIVMRVTSFYTVIKFGFEIIGSQPLFKSRSLCSIFHLRLFWLPCTSIPSIILKYVLFDKHGGELTASPTSEGVRVTLFVYLFLISSKSTE